MGSEFKIYLLGPLAIERPHADANSLGPARKSSRSVLRRLLTLPGRRGSRGQIQEDLWSDLDQGLADQYIDIAISQIRGILGDRDLLKKHDSFYELADQTQIWTDLDACTALLCEIEERRHTEGAIALLEEALGYLSRGDALEGEEGTWRLGIQGRAEDMLKQCRIWLAEILRSQQKHWQAAEQYRLLTQELPLDEEALRLYEEHRVHAAAVVLAPASLSALPSADGMWPDDLLAMHAAGIDACWSLYYSGQPHQVERLLPLYRMQTATLAQQPGPLQVPAARLASMAAQLACEVSTDREDFGAAGQAAQQAFVFGRLAAGDRNLQVGALIGLANLGFHRKLSTAAINAYEHAIHLLDESVTPLLKGRTYAGAAEVYAMRGAEQEALRAMGLAYEIYPERPEEDPAYPYLHASRYALYVFGDAQSRLFLGQPKEADKALIAGARETDTETEPITKADMLFYLAQSAADQDEIEQAASSLIEGAQLTRYLGSRLYFGKLLVVYEGLRQRWPHEPRIEAIGEAFAPW